MGNGFQFLDIILFAAVAAFLVLRLRSKLGNRTGEERKPEYDPFKGERPREEKGKDTVIPLPDRAAHKDAEGAGTEATGQKSGLTQIQIADQSFSPESFISGARAAFEMIVQAFAEGDTKTLRPLLANEVYEDFAGAIGTRQENKQTLETTLVGIESADIVEAELQGRTAFITVKFISEQVNVLRDKDGELVEGDPNRVTKVTDVWTFARNTRSRDPNWTLVATRSED